MDPFILDFLWWEYTLALAFGAMAAVFVVAVPLVTMLRDRE